MGFLYIKWLLGSIASSFDKFCVLFKIANTVMSVECNFSLAIDPHD